MGQVGEEDTSEWRSRVMSVCVQAHSSYNSSEYLDIPVDGEDIRCIQLIYGSSSYLYAKKTLQNHHSTSLVVD